MTDKKSNRHTEKERWTDGKTEWSHRARWVDSSRLKGRRSDTQLNRLVGGQIKSWSEIQMERWRDKK